MKININIEADYYPDACTPLRRRKILREFVSSGDREKFLTTQHERDEETGLDYRGARFYDSDIGRFLSLDPLAHIYPTLSDYSYVAGNPIIYTDPTGKTIETDYYDENNKFLGHVEDGSSQKIQTTKAEWTKAKFIADKGGFDISKNYIHGSAFTKSFRTTSTFKEYTGNSSNNESATAESNSDNSDIESPINPVGPALIAAGQPIKALKPVGALGSKPGSSLASYGLRKALPQRLPGRVLGTKVLGGAIGRATPIVGWALLLYDYNEIMKSHPVMSTEELIDKYESDWEKLCPDCGPMLIGND